MNELEHTVSVFIGLTLLSGQSPTSSLRIRRNYLVRYPRISYPGKQSNCGRKKRFERPKNRGKRPKTIWTYPKWLSLSNTFEIRAKGSFKVLVEERKFSVTSHVMICQRSILLESKKRTYTQALACKFNNIPFECVSDFPAKFRAENLKNKSTSLNGER